MWKSVQNAAQRTKLQGEVALLEREATARKKLFGIELYDMLQRLDKKNRGDVLHFPSGSIEKSIKEPLEECSKDVLLLEGELAEKETELESLEVRRERDTTGGIGKWVSNTSTEGSLNVRMKLLERKIKIRKEDFGVQIWDAVSSGVVVKNSSSDVDNNKKKKKGGLGKVRGAIGGVVNVATNSLGKLSADNRAIEQCLEKAKEDVQYIEESIRRKHSIMEGLRG